MASTSIQASGAKMSYCECCGRPLSEIRAELLLLPKHPSGVYHTDGKHTLYINSGHIYANNNELNNCTNCGKLLPPEAINSDHEFMGMYGSSRAYQEIITGYKCPHCNNEENF